MWFCSVKNSEETRWLGSRRINRGRKSLIFLPVCFCAVEKPFVPGTLTAVLLFGNAFRGATPQTDLPCISILHPSEPGHRQRGMLISTVPLLLLLPPPCPFPFASQPGHPLLTVIHGLDLPSHYADDPGQRLPLLINCQIIFGTSTYAFLEVQFSAMIIY